MDIRNKKELQEEVAQLMYKEYKQTARINKNGWASYLATWHDETYTDSACESEVHKGFVKGFLKACELFDELSKNNN